MSKVFLSVFGTFRLSRRSRVSRTSRIFIKSRVFKVSKLVIKVNTYIYDPLLDEESIRVLTLDPGEDCYSLTGALEVIHLSTPTPTSDSTTPDTHSSATGVIRWVPDKSYEAISYVWGSEEKNNVIFLDGKPHRITANLSDALHQCRLSDQPRVLWADSICIDQDKLEEKNHQVYIMGRIYASSQRTLICLGTDPGNCDHARNAFEMIYYVNRMIQETYQSPDFSWEVNSFPWPLPDDPLADESRWQSINILTSNSWFSRGWVVQEAALGREARLLWAGFEIAFLDLIRVDAWYNLRLKYQLDQLGRINIGWEIPVVLLLAIHQERRAEFMVYFESEINLVEPDILSVLHYARTQGLSDPRDRIYAFMALPFIRNQLPALRPNYNQPHLELYQDFAIRYLEQTSDLNLLCYVTYEERNEESLEDAFKSSWVPRWDHNRRKISSHLGRRDIRRFGQTSADSAEFVILRGENDSTASLQVRAVIFDPIRLVSPHFSKFTTVEDLITFWPKWSKKSGSATDSGWDASSSAHDSTMFLSAMSSGSWPWATRENRAAHLNSYSELLQKGASPDPGSLGNYHITPAIRFCHQNLIDKSEGFRVFLLKRGYYGLGPSAIKQDDVCTFVFGVSDPLILRKVPGAGAHYYKVIGPAYVVSKCLGNQDEFTGLCQMEEWQSWDEICETEKWTDWGLKEEEINLI